MATATHLEPAEPSLDPNHNLVYERVIEVDDVEHLGRVKWDLFRVESLLRRAVRNDPRLRGSYMRGDLERALERFDEHEDVARYRERFIRDADRLTHEELVSFYLLAHRVQELLHAAYVRYLRHIEEVLRTRLAEVDTEDVVRGAEALESGTVLETRPRRTRTFIVHTKKSTREIFAEVDYRDYSQIISWHEQMIPRLEGLVSEARIIYAQKQTAQQAVHMTEEVRNLVRVVAAATGIAALAAAVTMILFIASLS